MKRKHMINENIERLIHLKLSSEISVEENKELNSWIVASVENKSEFDRYVRMWNNVDLNPELVDLDNAFSKFKTKLNTETKPSSFRWIAAAAVLFTLSYYLFFYVSSTILETSTSRKEFALEDGSTIKMNRNSNIEYTFTDDERVIRLEGEGLFQVKKDGRPFIVETPTSIVKVLGTKFNVKASDQGTTVTVIEGRVSFRARKKGSRRVILERGMKSKSDNYEIDNSNFSGSISWLNDRIIFNDMTLSSITNTLQLEFGIEIRIATDSIKERRVTASMNDISPHDILKSLTNLLDVNLTREEDVYIIR